MKDNVKRYEPEDHCGCLMNSMKEDAEGSYVEYRDFYELWEYSKELEKNRDFWRTAAAGSDAELERIMEKRNDVQ